MTERHKGQFSRYWVHVPQHTKWPQGTNTKHTSSLMQTLHVRSSFNLRISFTNELEAEKGNTFLVNQLMVKSVILFIVAMVLFFEVDIHMHTSIFPHRDFSSINNSKKEKIHKHHITYIYRYQKQLQGNNQ